MGFEKNYRLLLCTKSSMKLIDDSIVLNKILFLSFEEDIIKDEDKSQFKIQKEKNKNMKNEFIHYHKTKEGKFININSKKLNLIKLKMLLRITSMTKNLMVWHL